MLGTSGYRRGVWRTPVESVARDSMPDVLEVTAMSDDGEIMALRHRQYDIHGIQFHPESVLTPEGHTIINNFLKG